MTVICNHDYSAPGRNAKQRCNFTTRSGSDMGGDRQGPPGHSSRPKGSTAADEFLGWGSEPTPQSTPARDVEKRCMSSLSGVPAVLFGLKMVAGGNNSTINSHLNFSECIFARPIVKRFALCYQTVVLSCLSVLSVALVYCGPVVGRIKMKLGTRTLGQAPHCCARIFAPHFTRCNTRRPAPPQAHILPNA